MSQRSAEPRFRAEIERRGGTVTGVYNGTHQPIACVCPAGHPCNPRPVSVLSGQGMCRICAGNDPADCERRFRAEIERRGGHVTGDYNGSSQPITCVCPAGHPCNPCPDSVLRGQGICRICAGTDSADCERRFRAEIERRGGHVTGDYNGSSQPITCVCPAGHPCNPRPTDVLRGGGICRICAGTDSADCERRFRTEIERRGGQVVGEYVNSPTPIACVCPAGHPCNPRPNSVLSGQGMCGICAGKDTDTAALRFYDSVESHGGHAIGDYITNHIPVHCRCPWGHDCWPTPSHLSRGYQGLCGQCQREHNAFYVVSDGVNVKLGITSGKGSQRLSDHRADGYTQVIFLAINLPTNVADNTERQVLNNLKDKGFIPIKGREYFGPEAFYIVLDLVAEYLGSYSAEVNQYEVA
jgi:general stress protein YciG